MTCRTCIFAGAALALGLAATPAAAEDVPTVEVYFGDLDLDTDEGVARFDRRLENAIEILCGGPPQANLIFGGAARRCQQETMADVRGERDYQIEFVRSEGAANLRQTRLAIRLPARYRS